MSMKSTYLSWRSGSGSRVAEAAHGGGVDVDPLGRVIAHVGQVETGDQVVAVAVAPVGDGGELHREEVEAQIGVASPPSSSWRSAGPPRRKTTTGTTRPVSTSSAMSRQ